MMSTDDMLYVVVYNTTVVFLFYVIMQ